MKTLVLLTRARTDDDRLAIQRAVLGACVDAMALVCPRHHTDIHHGVWHLKMRHGIPWARPPVWIGVRTGPPDPDDGRWVRNTIHHTMDAARRLGQQLRLDLDSS